MWMGGNPPLGYDIRDRKLVLNPAEAETVKRLFALYLELGCVRRVKEAADRLGLVSKHRIANRQPQGGKPFSRGHIYKLLSNPIYTGRIAHKSQLYQGQHAALIEDDIWAAVLAGLAGNGPERHRAAAAREPSLLAGLLFDAAGEHLSPSHAVKQGRRYRYYVSRALIAEAGTDSKRGLRLPAHDLEQAVIIAVIGMLRDGAGLIERLAIRNATAEEITGLLDSAGRIAAELDQGSPAGRSEVLGRLLTRIVIDNGGLTLLLRQAALTPGTEQAATAEDQILTLRVPLQLRYRGVEMKLVVPGPGHHTKPLRDPALIKAVARAYVWFQELATGHAGSLRDIAEREAVTDGYVGRLIRLAFLAPPLVEAILEGAQPVDLTAARLTALTDLPLDWTEQQQLVLD
jgi:site-specific DNA recombinase